MINISKWSVSQLFGALIICLSSGAAISSAHGSESDSDQAYVARLGNVCSAITLTRGDTTGELRLLETVFNGDEISADCAEGKKGDLIAELSFSDGQSKQIRIGNEPYRVDHQFEHRGTLANMWAWTRAALGLASDAKPVRMAGTHGKGLGEIEVPWAKAVASVRPDRQKLYVYWIGGGAPFSIVTKNSDGEVLEQQDGLTGRQSRVGFPATAPELVIEIMPKAGEPVVGTVTRMTEDDWVGLQENIAGDAVGSFPPELIAVAMMTDTEGRLLLEAYQQVAREADEGESATSLVKEMMEFGDLPDLVQAGATDQ